MHAVISNAFVRQHHPFDYVCQMVVVAVVVFWCTGAQDSVCAAVAFGGRGSWASSGLGPASGFGQVPGLELVSWLGQPQASDLLWGHGRPRGLESWGLDLALGYGPAPGLRRLLGACGRGGRRWLRGRAGQGARGAKEGAKRRGQKRPSREPPPSHSPDPPACIFVRRQRGFEGVV